MIPEPASALAGILEAENAALRALDFPTATALLADKQRALAAMTGAPPPPHAALRRVQLAAAENRALLERAIAVQARVVGIVTRAARPKPRFYSARGYATGPSRAAPLCFRSEI